MSLYKNYAQNPDFRRLAEESIIRIPAIHESGKPA